MIHMIVQNICVYKNICIAISIQFNTSICIYIHMCIKIDIHKSQAGFLFWVLFIFNGRYLTIRDAIGMLVCSCHLNFKDH